MIHVVAMKCRIGLPLLMRIELLRRGRSRSFKNRGVEVGVGAFVYRLHSPDQHPLCTLSSHVLTTWPFARFPGTAMLLHF
jgi:hypothetical protein